MDTYIFLLSKNYKVLVICIAVLFLSGCYAIKREPLSPIKIKDYEITIEPQDENLEHLIIQEKVILIHDSGFESQPIVSTEIITHTPPNSKPYTSTITHTETHVVNELEFEMPTRVITNSQRGLFLKEIEISPLDADPFFIFPLPDGREFQVKKQLGLLSSVSERLNYLETNVKLIDFPADSFYSAKNATNIQVQKYLDTETVSWSSTEPGSDIQFAYLPPPYHHLHPNIRPFVEIFSVEHLIFSLIGITITFVGLIITIILKPAVVPTLVSATEGKIKLILSKLLYKKPDETVTLIVVEDGKEKKKEIKLGEKKK